MPSKKGTDQAVTWLRSKMAEKDTLDAINAEVCYNVIMDLRRQKESLGAIYQRLKETTERERAKYDYRRNDGDRYDADL